MDNSDVQKEITCLRASLRKYLEEEISEQRIDVETAKRIATYANEKISQQLVSWSEIEKAMVELKQEFPVMEEAVKMVGWKCSLDEKKKYVDDYVLKMISEGRLDEALAGMEKIDISGGAI